MVIYHKLQNIVDAPMKIPAPFATHEEHDHDIPCVFCWTKMGAEAGQPLDAIVRRKDLERRAGDGTFAWGIGNSLGTATELARQVAKRDDVDVLFSPMKSAPKLLDSAPSKTLLWIYYLDRNGEVSLLPEHMVVTSRGGNGKQTHYALLCSSEETLALEDSGTLAPRNIRNLASMNPVGASQVTAVVHYEASEECDPKPYRVAFRAKLFGDGFVRLVKPCRLEGQLLEVFDELNCASSPDAWIDSATRLRRIASKLKGVPVQSSLI